MKIAAINIETRIALLYLLFGGLWILLSDRVLSALISDPKQMTMFQTYKGWFFIAASALLIYGLLHRFLAVQRSLDAILHENEERFRLLFDTSLDAILLTAPDGSIFAANPSACRVFGRTEAEICRNGRSGVFDPTDPRLTSALEERRRTGQFQGELSFLRKDGSSFDGEIATALFKDTAGRERASMIIRDITERKTIEKNMRASEEELRQLNAELEQRVAERMVELEAALVKAQESDRLKSAFLATMSHELRTPLNSIIGFTGVLAQGLAGPLNDEQFTQLGMVRRSSHHLLSLINDVLDLSKIEAGQLELRKTNFDLRLVIDEVLKITTPAALKKNLRINCIFDPSIRMVWSDRRRVEQILLNLVNNAIKFTDQGQVQIECRAVSGGLEISVCDNGIGIKPEDLPILFRPFTQIEAGLNRKHEGSGLGLSICKNLVHLLGGEIDVQSEWGQGSTFTVKLPAPAE